MFHLRLKQIHFFGLFFGFLIVSNSVTAQFQIPEKPSFQTSVYDYANVLEQVEKQELEQKLVRYSDSTSTQIVVITVAEINGEDIGILTPKWAHEWGIGQKDKDNGILILLAKKERKIWIAPGYGVEDRLTAGITGEIVRNNIIPEFKKGNYYEGLDNGATSIFEVLKGKYKGTRKKDFNVFPFIIIIIFIVLFIILASRGNKNGNSGGSTGFDLSDIIILSSLGRSSGRGFGGGGGSSGGFGGGFGGGGFSGGGAGGSW